MKNNFVLGLSCCFIGGYNFWSFYIQEKLYIFNFSCYFTTFLIGILFFYRGWAYHSKIIQNLQQNQNSNEKKTEKIEQSNQYTVKVIELQENSKQYAKVSKYISGLLICQGGVNYILKRIFKIKNDNIKKKFKDYQKKISEVCKCEGMQGPSNTNYNFHATNKICLDSPCKGENAKDCPLCNIIKEGFKRKFAGKGQSTNLRFGNGIYFSPDIKKALSYAQGQNPISLLMSKVVLGKVYFAKDSESHLDEYNEKIYHSIYGDPRIAHDLKQPEICIFKDEGCWPKYLLEFEEK